MGGKTMVSSTSSDTLKISSISKREVQRLVLASKEPTVDRARFMHFMSIIGGRILHGKEFTEWFIFNTASRAAVAGERAAECETLVEPFMIVGVQELMF
jgi:hypothetical protein